MMMKVNWSVQGILCVLPFYILEGLHLSVFGWILFFKDFSLYYSLTTKLEVLICIRKLYKLYIFFLFVSYIINVSK